MQSPRTRSGASPDHLSESVSAASYLHKKALWVCFTESREVLSLKYHFFPTFPTSSEQLLGDTFQAFCSLRRISLLVTLHVAHWVPRRGHLLDMDSKWLILRAA